MDAFAKNGNTQLDLAKVVSLTRHEKRLVGAWFLGTVVSGAFDFCLAAWLVSLIAVGMNQLVYGLGLTALLLWSCAISRMWRAVILVMSAGACLVLTFVVLTVAVKPTSITELGAPTAALFLLLTHVPAIFFVLPMLSDGIRLAATPVGERELFAVIDRHSRLTQALGVALGIHPICTWLPRGWRRLTAGSLFLLAAVAKGAMVVGVMVGLLLSTLPTLFLTVVVGGVLAVVSGLLRYLARRYGRVSAENLTEIDQRPPVLFLRSFKEDQVTLDQPKRGFVRAVVETGVPDPTLDHVLIEELTSSGPVVAIGVPGAPAPFGAARTYADDSEWQNVIAKLAREASIIVIVLDDTEGVNWELSHIIDNGYLSKTLHLLPPRFAARTESAANIVRGALLDNKCALAKPLGEPCIGWYRTHRGETALLVSGRPNQASYVCAVRMFRENHKCVRPA
jgi:hypothetical protein